jgi:hypothetical protein
MVNDTMGDAAQELLLDRVGNPGPDDDQIRIHENHRSSFSDTHRTASVGSRTPDGISAEPATVAGRTTRIKLLVIGNSPHVLRVRARMAAGRP